MSDSDFIGLVDFTGSPSLVRWEPDSTATVEELVAYVERLQRHPVYAETYELGQLAERVMAAARRVAPDGDLGRVVIATTPKLAALLQRLNLGGLRIVASNLVPVGQAYALRDPAWREPGR